MVAANIIRSIEDKALRMRELIVTDLIGEDKVCLLYTSDAADE